MLEESSCPADGAEFNCFSVNMGKWLMTNVSIFFMMCELLYFVIGDDSITRTGVGYDDSLLIF